MAPTCTIFFSWQSNVEKCKSLITEALIEIKKENQALNINIEESTANLPGAPDIGQSIRSKIERCNLFIADITIVARIGEKYHSNQNVIYECGYACSCLGEDRIILLFEENQGEISDLPFDINHNRISRFSTSFYGLNGEEKRKGKEEEKKRIKSYINETLSLLLSSNRLFTPDEYTTQYPKIEIDRDSRGGKADNLYFELINASPKILSGLQVNKMYVRDENKTTIQKLDVSKASFEPKVIKPGGKTQLFIYNSAIENEIAQHPKEIIIIISCSDENYDTYYFKLCGTVQKYNSLEKITWSIEPIKRK